jgi:hypothetical protein
MHKIFHKDILATVCFTCNNISQREKEKLIVNETGIGSGVEMSCAASDFHFSVHVIRYYFVEHQSTSIPKVFICAI